MILIIGVDFKLKNNFFELFEHSQGIFVFLENGVNIG